MGNGASFNCTVIYVNGSEYRPPNAEQGTSDSLWLIGMVFTVLSSFAVSFGTVLQKKAHVDDLNKPRELRAPRKYGLLCSRMWLFGFLIMVLLQIPLTFAALAMAPQSIVIPLGAGATIVLTQILAVCILKEKVGRIEVFSTLLIIVGVILTTTANAGGTKSLSACQILNRYTDTDFLVPIIILLVAISFCAVTLHYDFACAQGFKPAVFAFIAGGLGAILNIMLKVVGEFTQGALSGEGEAQAAWDSIHPYYHLLVVFFLAFGMISFINQGLERFNASSYLNLYNCLFIILCTLLGALFFREFDTFGTKALIMFPLGIIVTLVGISIISWAARPQESKMVGIGEDEEGGMEMGGRGRGPSDPLEHVFMDADTEMDAKAYAEAPVLSRLVLI